jgi:hypothetical protein
VITQTGRESFCQLLARHIAYLKQEIRNKEHRIRTLNARLSELLSQPNPDPAVIQEIRADIQELEVELETDRPQLNATEEDFAASCRP